MSTEPTAPQGIAAMRATAAPDAREDGASSEGWGARGHEAVMKIPVDVRIVLGAARMSVAKLMSLTKGAIVPLDRKVGELVEIVVNNRIVARGEVVVLDEEASRFAVAVREIVSVSDE